MIAFLLAAEIGHIPLPRGGGYVSVGFALLFGVGLIYGPEVAAWLGALGTINLDEFTGKVPLRGLLFNRAQLALSAGLAAVAYQGIGGIPGSLDYRRDAAAIAAAALVYYLLNAGLVMIYVSLLKGMPVRDQWAVNFRWSAPNYLLQVPIAVVLAALYQSIGVLAIFFIIAPLLVTRHNLQRFIDRRQVFMRTIRTLGAILEAKDPYTKGHSDRVGRYAGAIVRRLGMREEWAERVELAGILHDLGKLGVRQRVLNKKGRLESEELAEMRLHPAYGAEIIRHAGLLGEGYRWIRHHHERLDGEGYPEGLEGDRIPLESRVILVADAFDAMTTNRSYRDAFGYERAVAELRKHAGTQFAPELVEAMVGLTKDFSPIAPVAEGDGR